MKRENLFIKLGRYIYIYIISLWIPKKEIKAFFIYLLIYCFPLNLTDYILPRRWGLLPALTNGLDMKVLTREINNPSLSLLRR
jgi:hypothetical protein